MNFQIVWSDSALNELDRIFAYYTYNVSLNVAESIIQSIISEPNRLLSNQKIAQIEELLLDREDDYRYLLCKSYKIIYSIDQKQGLIKIADVFDTRQNPDKIKRNK